MLGSLFKDLTKIFGKPGSFSPYTEQYISISAGGEKVYERGEKSEDVSKLEENAKFIPAAVAIDTQRVFRMMQNLITPNPWGSFPLLPLSMPNQPQLNTLVNSHSTFYVYPWNAFNGLQFFERDVPLAEPSNSKKFWKRKSESTAEKSAVFAILESIVLYGILNGYREEMPIVKNMPEDFKKQLNPEFIESINKEYARVVKAFENSEAYIEEGKIKKFLRDFKESFVEWSPKIDIERAMQKKLRYELITADDQKEVTGYVYNTFDNPMRKKSPAVGILYIPGVYLSFLNGDCLNLGYKPACKSRDEIKEGLKALSDKIDRLMIAYYIYRLSKDVPYLRGYTLKEQMSGGGKIVRRGRDILREHRRIYDGPVSVALEGILNQRLYEVPLNYNTPVPIFARKEIADLQPYFLIYQEGSRGLDLGVENKNMIQFYFSVGQLGKEFGQKFGGKLDKKYSVFLGLEPGEGIDEWDTTFELGWDTDLQYLYLDSDKVNEMKDRINKLNKMLREDPLFSSRLESSGAKKYFSKGLTLPLTFFTAGPMVLYAYFENLRPKDVQKILGLELPISENRVDLKIATVRSYQMDEYACGGISPPYYIRTLTGPETGLGGKFVYLALQGKEHILQYLGQKPVEVTGGFVRSFNVLKKNFYEEIFGYAHITLEKTFPTLEQLDEMYVEAGGFPVKIKVEERPVIGIYEAYIERVRRGK